MSLTHSAMSLLTWEAAEMWSKGTIPGPMGTAHRNRAPYQAFSASDGSFVVGAGNESTWRSLCRAIERPDLVEDPRFATNPQRVRNVEPLVAILSEIFETETVEHWTNVLGAAGCPVTPILNVAEAFASEHARERGMTIELDSPVGEEKLPSIGFPYSMKAHPPRVYRRPPALGEQSRGVLARLAALDEDEIDVLVADGIVGEHVLEG